MEKQAKHPAESKEIHPSIKQEIIDTVVVSGGAPEAANDTVGFGSMVDRSSFGWWPQEQEQQPQPSTRTASTRIRLVTYRHCN